MAKAQAYLYKAIDQLQYGTANDSSFEVIFKHLEEARKRDPNELGIYGILAKGYYYKAISEMLQRRDPEGSLAMADKAIEDLRAIFPNASSISANTGLLRSRGAGKRCV